MMIQELNDYSPRIPVMIRDSPRMKRANMLKQISGTASPETAATAQEATTRPVRARFRPAKTAGPRGAAGSSPRRPSGRRRRRGRCRPGSPRSLGVSRRRRRRRRREADPDREQHDDEAGGHRAASPSARSRTRRS
jgi:hypothetical protein